MDIDKLHQAAQRPELYEKGDAEMWTDEYISKKLLEIHLDPGIDSASRTPGNIERTVKLIRKFCPRPVMDILDLGCGPGIYLEKLAQMGHHCTGVDFSANSIAYAESRAKENELDITYLCQDYLDLEFERRFDLILLIYTDLGVLLPADRSSLLKKIHRALKPEGTLIFDVVNAKNSALKFKEESHWSYENGGFWRDGPYMEVVNGFHYPQAKVFLRQHTIMDDSDHITNYRFWMHYFSFREIDQILKENGFADTEEYDRVLLDRDEWSGENISFYKTEKK